MSANPRTLLGSVCFVLSAVWAAMFLLVAVTKLTSPGWVPVLALVLYGVSAAAFFLAGRRLFRPG